MFKVGDIVEPGIRWGLNREHWPSCYAHIYSRGTVKMVLSSNPNYTNCFPNKQVSVEWEGAPYDWDYDESELMYYCVASSEVSQVAGLSQNKVLDSSLFAANYIELNQNN